MADCTLFHIIFFPAKINTTFKLNKYNTWTEKKYYFELKLMYVYIIM